MARSPQRNQQPYREKSNSKNQSRLKPTRRILSDNFERVDRIRQYLEKMLGFVPEEGDHITVRFSDDSTTLYKVESIASTHNVDNRDKFMLSCSHCENNGDTDYPDSIVIGYRTGVFEREE